MKTRPKFRVTIRVANSDHLCEDVAGRRFVIFRRAGGVVRKTSRRYTSHYDRNAALEKAEQVAWRLSRCPARKLAAFRFSP